MVGTTGLACSRREHDLVEAKESAQKDAAHKAKTAPINEARVATSFELPRGTPWPTRDPFLFCVHHLDNFPRGNTHLGPLGSLTGRELGQDFSGRDGFSMYHGRQVPGFPRHPHRGFETVTVVRQGRLDHSDSLGAVARYGDGDVQWLTAGAGIQHAEMFPLLNSAAPNPLDLFQIWLNLPAKRKLVSPYFSMLWAAQIPEHEFQDSEGHTVKVSVRAGRLGELSAPPPPPDSWAASPDNDVAIITVALGPYARFQLPAALPRVSRSLYCSAGTRVELGGAVLHAGRGVHLDSHLALSIENGREPSELLLLQGRPIGEPVARRGPFVMNTDAELRQAFSDYERTEFGGWPWPATGPVHGPNPARFARRGDGKLEQPT